MGKEEIYRKALLEVEAGQQGELKSEFIGRIRKVASIALAASPCTASNEDKFIWTDELVKNYAEGYRFSSSRLSIEKFKESKWLSQESVERNYKLAMEEVEPKAVQQAAEDFASEIVAIPEERWDNFHQKEWEKVKSYFLAGASFNKDAVEFGEWIGNNFQRVFWQTREYKWCDNHVADYGGKDDDYFTTQELYNLYLDSIKQIKQ